MASFTKPISILGEDVLMKKGRENVGWVAWAWGQLGREFFYQMTDKVNFFPHHFNFSHHALGKVMAQRQKVRPREGKKAEWQRQVDTSSNSLYGPLWGASTCRSRWETHLYFLKSREGMERGRSIADRTCVLNMMVRWLNRPLWGRYNSRLHTAPALTGSAHPPHTRHTLHLALFHRDTRLRGKGVDPQERPAPTLY